MTWRGWLIAACLAAGPAAAQTIPVRSGEHDGFSRLVFDIPPGLAWSLETDKSKNRARLTLGTGRPQLETEGVFDRIDTARVAALLQEPNSAVVNIDMNCACDVSAFVLRDRMLVVDVSESDEPSAQPVETADDTLRQAFTTVVLDDVPRVGPAPVQDALPRPLRIEPHLENARAEIARRAAAEEDLGEGLTQRLAQAATQGLLTPAVTPPAPPPAPSPKALAQQPETEPSSLVSQLETALAGLQANPTDSRQIRIGAKQCVPDQALDLASWSTVDNVVDAVSMDRQRLFGEFDKVDESVLQDLVQSYLHFGFGAEARALLPLAELPNDDVLRALSYLLDDKSDPNRHFRGQAGCSGAAALWALLDHANEPIKTEIDTNAVLRAFEELPQHLKSYLGPILASRLTEANQTEAARSMLSRLKRQEGETTDQIALGTARLDALDGAVAQAEAVLGDLARSNGPTAPEALTGAIALANENDLPIEEDLVDLSAAFATELRATEDGAQMWQTYQDALLSSGRFDEAFDRLNTATDLPDKQMAEMWRSGLAALTERAPDVTFLKHVLRTTSERPDAVDVTLQRAIATRLLDLGMPDPALDILQTNAFAANERAHKLLQARAHLALSQPEQAEILLIGLSGEESTALRAEARRMMGDFDYAQLAYDAIGNEDAALESAWLSSDWQRVSASEVPALAQAADLAQNAVTAPTEPSLAGATSLVSASEAARAALRDLLETTGIEESENSLK